MGNQEHAAALRAWARALDAAWPERDDYPFGIGRRPSVLDIGLYVQGYTPEQFRGLTEVEIARRVRAFLPLALEDRVSEAAARLAEIPSPQRYTLCELEVDYGVAPAAIARAMRAVAEDLTT